MSPPGSCHSTKKNRCIPQSICCSHGSLPEPLLHSLWRGLCCVFITSLFQKYLYFDQVTFANLFKPLILQKLANLSLRIQQIETTLSILEAKVSSVACQWFMTPLNVSYFNFVVILWAAVLYTWTWGCHCWWTRSTATKWTYCCPPESTSWSNTRGAFNSSSKNKSMDLMLPLVIN